MQQKERKKKEREGKDLPRASAFQMFSNLQSFLQVQPLTHSDTQLVNLPCGAQNSKNTKKDGESTRKEAIPRLPRESSLEREKTKWESKGVDRRASWVCVGGSTSKAWSRKQSQDPQDPQEQGWGEGSVCAWASPSQALLTSPVRCSSLPCLL